MKNIGRSLCAVLAGLALAASVMAAPIGGGSGDTRMNASNVSVQHDQALVQPAQAQAVIALAVAVQPVAVGHRVVVGSLAACADIQPYGLGRHINLASLPRPPNETPHSG